MNEGEIKDDTVTTIPERRLEVFMTPLFEDGANRSICGWLKTETQRFWACFLPFCRDFRSLCGSVLKKYLFVEFIYQVGNRNTRA